MNRIPAPTRTQVTLHQVLLALSLLILLTAAEVHPASATPVRASERAQSGDLVLEILQTGRGNTDFEVNDELVFRVRAFDSSVGTRDGDGIRNVDMIILDADGREVYRRREGTAGYCAFGGGEPNCNAFDFAANDNLWPSGTPIRDGGEYTLRAFANAADGRRAAIGIPIQINLRDAYGSSDLVVEMMQTGRNNTDFEVNDELVFRVRAFDPSVGNRDGDGIRNVDMIILDEDGREVYRRRESTVGYCAFGGGEPNCNVFDFAANDDQWPNGEPIRDGGEYTLRTLVNARDGRRTSMDTSIQINLRDGGTDLVAEVMQTGRSGNSSVVDSGLVFRIRAFDPRRGSRDGDGIRNVDMIILDPDGREVYRKRESTAGYCAFGGGEPNCAVFDLADNDFTWPNGDEIRRGEEYTLRAVVNATDGRRTTINRTVEIR